MSDSIWLQITSHLLQKPLYLKGRTEALHAENVMFERKRQNIFTVFNCKSEPTEERQENGGLMSLQTEYLQSKSGL